MTATLHSCQPRTRVPHHPARYLVEIPPRRPAFSPLWTVAAVIILAHAALLGLALALL